MKGASQSITTLNHNLKTPESVHKALVEQFQNFLTQDELSHEAIVFVYLDDKKYSKLYSLFEGACFMTDSAAHSPPTLPKSDCKEFLLEFGIIVPFQFPESELENLYKLIAPTSPSLLYPQFLILLFELAYKVNVKIRDKISRIDLFKLLLENILSSGDEILNRYLRLVPKANFDSSYMIERVFFEYEFIIKKIFDKYCIIKPQTGLKLIPWNNLIQICTTFEIAPKQITMFELNRIFSTFENVIIKYNREECIDFHQFQNFLLRISIFLYHKEPYRQRLTTLESRMLQFFSHIRPTYEKMFDTKMHAELIPLEHIQVPEITMIEPSFCFIQDSISATIFGFGFDRRKGGTKVMFGNQLIPVDSNKAQQTRLSIAIPLFDPLTVQSNLSIQMEQQTMGILVYIRNEYSVQIRVSNDGMQFSDSCVIFTYLDCLPPVEISQELTMELESIFEAFLRTDKQQAKSVMSIRSWKIFKKAISDCGILFSPLDLSLKEHIIFENQYDYEYLLFRNELLNYLDYLSFLKCCIYILFSTKQQLHPLDFLVLLVQNQSKLLELIQQDQHSNSSEKKFVYQLNSMPKQEVRCMDVYCGATQIGQVKDQQGNITDTNGNSIRANFVFSYHHLDINTEKTVLTALLHSAQTFDQFIVKMIQIGFDVVMAQHNKKQQYSRCWNLMKGRRKIGAMWDGAGQLNTIDFHPLETSEFTNPIFTICLYEKLESQEFILVSKLYKRNVQTIVEVREFLERQGVQCRTVNYRAI